MDKQVLVAYGTKYGGTAEIAECIGQVLRDADLVVDVMPADRAGDPSRYDAVIVGSGVYIGQWRKEAAKFVKDHAAALAGRKVWLFSSGPTDEGDPVELLNGWRLPGKLQATVDHISPQEVAVFHGVLDPGKLNFIERWMIKRVGSSMGDFRDWEAISAWARSIADELQAADSSSEAPQG
jgi:menaquinone-dependent protoporphyrinogen oxidase